MSTTTATERLECHDCHRPIKPGDRFYMNVPIPENKRIRSHLCPECHAARFPATALVATPIADQPAPMRDIADQPAVWDLVIADMRERDVVGRQRYGTPLQPHNGRDALVDAYQEALDLAVYLRQAIYERSGR